MKTMKKINLLLTSLLLTASVCLTQQANAQAPQKMSYQSVIRNSSNALVANTTVGIQLSVLQGSASGTAVYVETQTATTNANGLVSLQIGNGTATSGTFTDIDWATGPYFIKTETDPTGGSNYSITGTQEILSVPYAMYAKNGITTAQADAITAQISNNASMQAQITALQTQVAGLISPILTTVVIGTQTWTSTNLNVTTYRDGTPIPEVQDPTAWASLTTGAWCHLNNDPANDAIYGKMYNHYAVEDPRGLAPVGYRIPTMAEWNVLFENTGGWAACSPKLRSAAFNGTNDYGFSVLNGGYRTGFAMTMGPPDPFIWEGNHPAGWFLTHKTIFWCSDVLPAYNGVGMGDYFATFSLNYENNEGHYIRLLKI